MLLEDSSPEPKVALIRARWHADIVDRAVKGFQDRWGGNPLEIHDVPGAFEIPLRAKDLAATRQYAAIVAFGFVVDGGIYRHDFVASAVIDGLMRVQLEMSCPILSVVLTPHNFQPTGDLTDFFGRHFVHKGQEAATACATILAARGVPMGGLRHAD